MRALATVLTVPASWFALLLALGAPIALDGGVALLALCATAVALGVARTSTARENRTERRSP